MITIPAYVVSVLAIIGAIDYFWRAHKERSMLMLGKAISWMYLGVVYLIYYFGDVPSELRHTLGRLGIVAVLGTHLFYRGVEWRISKLNSRQS